MPESRNLAVCEIFNPDIHGITELSSKNITTQFLVHTKILPKEFYNNSYKNIIKVVKKGYYYYRWAEGPMHPIIKNYEHLLRRNEFPSLEIVIIKELDGMEQVAILKTIWLRIFQRVCKNYLNMKKKSLKILLKSPTSNLNN